MSQDAGGGLSYFSKHKKIHPRIVHGRFSRLRVVALFLTLGVLYVLPWLRWGDRPAFLRDLPRIARGAREVERQAVQRRCGLGAVERADPRHGVADLRRQGRRGHLGDKQASQGKS